MVCLGLECCGAGIGIYYAWVCRVAALPLDDGKSGLGMWRLWDWDMVSLGLECVGVGFGMW